MECLEFLGSHALRGPKGGMTSLRVAESVVIDAGNLLASLGDEIDAVEHLFLTHSHLDHINDLPYLIDASFETRRAPLRLYGTPQTLRNIHAHLFCQEIWADFTRIPLPGSDEPALRLVPIEYGRGYEVGGVTLTPVPNRHIPGSCGFLIDGGGGAILFTSDTGYDPSLTRLVDENPRIKALVTELSFPNEREDVARVSGHLTPSLLARQMAGLGRKDVPVYLNHAKPRFEEAIRRQVATEPGLAGFEVAWVEDGDCIFYATGRKVRRHETTGREDFHELLDIGTRLASETDRRALYREILRSARHLAHADAGTLYIVDEEAKELRFHIVQNDTLGIDAVAGEGEAVAWPPIPLYLEEGRPNRSMVAAEAALRGEVVSIPDIYRSGRFDFTGARQYDAMTGYRTVSMLVVPMKDYEGRVIGVLQLLNRTAPDGSVLPFADEEKRIACSLAALAAVAMQNRLLIEGLEAMVVTFLETLAKTLDEKSPYTGRHIERMTELSTMVAEAVDAQKEGPFAAVRFSEEAMRQIRLAALVHDIGKIAISDVLLEKSTKLEGVLDRIALVELRVELLKAQRRAEALEAALRQEGLDPEALLQPLEARLGEMDEAVARLERINRAQNPLTKQDLELIASLVRLHYDLAGEKRPLLEPEEAEALSVRQGTLTDAEKRVVDGHIEETRKSLERLTFPEKYRRIPEIAGAHHEKLDGSGYPLGLRGEEIPLEARILAVADIFEALTARDRPYKRPNRLSEAMRALYAMAQKGEIDRDLVALLYRTGLYRDYAKRFLDAEQIDEVPPPPWDF